MTPSQIISAEFARRGHDPVQALHWVHGLMKSKKASLLQHGDSVLLAIKLGDHDVEVHLYTQDKPMAIVRAVKHFMKEIVKSHIKRVYGKADNKHIVNLMKSVGVKVKKSDKPQYNWMALTGDH